MKCSKLCRELEVTCPVKECRYWLDYPEDYNCTFAAVAKNDKGMTLAEVGKRIHVTAARAKQIESEAIAKITSNSKALLALQTEKETSSGNPY